MFFWNRCINNRTKNDYYNYYYDLHPYLYTLLIILDAWRQLVNGSLFLFKTKQKASLYFTNWHHISGIINKVYNYLILITIISKVIFIAIIIIINHHHQLLSSSSIIIIIINNRHHQSSSSSSSSIIIIIIVTTITIICTIITITLFCANLPDYENYSPAKLQK